MKRGIRNSPSGRLSQNPEFTEEEENEATITPLPQERNFGTIATATSKTISVELEDNTVYDFTALAFADDEVGGVLYSKGIRARVFWRDGGALPVIIFQMNLDATTEGLGFTFTGALAAGQMVFTLSNTSGRTVPYALDLGYYSFEVL